MSVYLLTTGHDTVRHAYQMHVERGPYKTHIGTSEHTEVLGG